MQIDTGDKMVDIKATRDDGVVVTAFHCAGPDGPRQLDAYLAKQRADGYAIDVTGERPIMRDVPTREVIYDTEIAPLMKEIIAICKRADIPIVAGFQLDDIRGEDAQGLVCRTTIVPPDAVPRLLRASSALHSR